MYKWITLLVAVLLAAILFFPKGEGKGSQAPPSVPSAPAGQDVAAKREGGAARLLARTAPTARARENLRTQVAARCSSYLMSPSQERVKRSNGDKLNAWCKGLESVLSPAELPALLGSKSADSEVVTAATNLFRQGNSRHDLAEEVDLLSRSTSPQDFAAVSQVVDKYHADDLWGKAGLVRSQTPNAEVLARFAGLAAGCQVNYCGPDDLATLDVCTWPGSACNEGFDFQAALAANFSANDVERVRMLSEQLAALRKPSH